MFGQKTADQVLAKLHKDIIKPLEEIANREALLSQQLEGAARSLETQSEESLIESQRVYKILATLKEITGE